MDTGAEAIDYTEVAKAEKLRPIEIELRKLESVADGIVGEMEYMKQREAKMRDTNGMLVRGRDVGRIRWLNLLRFPSQRINERSSKELLAALNHRLDWAGHLADPVFAAILCYKEAGEYARQDAFEGRHFLTRSLFRFLDLRT